MTDATDNTGRAGRFITLEGPEGGGKSTQARRLADRLRSCGLEVLCTREPGGTPTGEVIRDILQHDKGGGPVCAEAEVLLFAASRAQLVRDVILPALARGAWVVCDRFADSTTAYQGYGRQLDVEAVLAVNSWAVGEATPDLTLLLDVDVALGFERLRSRHRAGGPGHDRIEREAMDFHERVRAGYLALARRWPGRFRVIDASGATPAVAAAIWSALSDVFRGQIQ